MRIILFVICFNLLNFSANAGEILQDAKIYLSVKKKTDKLVMMNPMKAEKMITESYDEITNNCCESNFNQLSQVNEIKVTLKKCIDKRCFSNMFPIWRKDKPPTKAISLAYAKLVDDLVTENLKLKYENQISSIIKEKNNQSEIAKLKNETNIDKIKKQFQKKLVSMESENSKLKTTIEKMLINYQNQILNLKAENDTLRSNFDKAYNLVPKSKRKKLEEEIE
ncbi:hypothetical protein N9U21_00595 [Candidatus Pelagibacter sp.]|nr:hypothetical protein [Candidatus Pelagibacter sp.]MDA9728093.1 hypothetical protein [Candidatus Pelagibacter sp.]